MNAGFYRLPGIVGIVDAIVDQPELVECRMDIDTRHHADSLDHGLGIPAVLPAHQFDGKRCVLVQYGVVKQHIATRCWHHLPAHVLPDQVRGDPLAASVPVDRVVAELLTVVSKVRQRVVDLADQQILTVIEASHRCFHAGDFTAFFLI